MATKPASTLTAPDTIPLDPAALGLKPAVWVPRAGNGGAGRPELKSPYIPFVLASMATRDENGHGAVFSFEVLLDGPDLIERSKSLEKHTRQLSKAGAQVEPAQTVRVQTSDIREDGTVDITFKAVPKIVKVPLTDAEKAAKAEWELANPGKRWTRPTEAPAAAVAA